MCGIVGFVSVKKREAKNLVYAALMQKERGDSDGIGLLYWTKQGWQTKKTMKKLSERVAKEFDVASDIAVFHHRLTSAGKTCLVNTHPIKYKDLYIIQNGHSIIGEMKIEEEAVLLSDKKIKDLNDTHGVARILSDEGIEAITWIGSGAYIIAREEEKALYIFRERYPLQIWLSEKMDLLLFASTNKALITLAGLLGVKVWKYRLYGSLEAYKLYKVEVEKDIRIRCIAETKLSKVQKHYWDVWR